MLTYIDHHAALTLTPADLTLTRVTRKCSLLRCMMVISTLVLGLSASLESMPTTCWPKLVTARLVSVQCCARALNVNSARVRMHACMHAHKATRWQAGRRNVRDTLDAAVALNSSVIRTWAFADG